MAPPLSVLDLSPVVEGGTAAESFRNTRDLARHAEACGYRRFWLAEHHNMPGIGNSATAVLIGYVAEGTSTIRVGAGGVMLPNHSPLIVAEQFGTLESLYPGRIDLGLGRAPGTDQETMTAIRRDAAAAADRFPEDVAQLLAYFRPEAPGQRVRAVPGQGLAVPVWLLGSSLFSARLAARLGLPFAFASHFAPDHLLHALEAYRREFRPSDRLDRPYAIATVNVIAADSDAEAARLFTSVQAQFIRLRRGVPGKLPPAIDPADAPWSRDERLTVAHTLRYAVVGGRDAVAEGLRAFASLTAADEILITGHIHDHGARLRSFEIVSQLQDLPSGAGPRREP